MSFISQTPSRGRLITVEGIDGCGKTTLTTGLLADLQAAGIDIVLLREPGGVALSERVRDVVKDPTLTVGAATEALLYAAARAQLVTELLEPTLASGQWVLLDRFVDSSLAYQGVARGLGLEAVRAINELATGGLTPDRTLLLALDPAVAVARQSDRGDGPDRLEQELGNSFHIIADAYMDLAAGEPDRFRVINADDTPANVRAAAVAALADLHA